MKNILILPSVSNHGYWIRPMILFHIFTHFSKNVLWLKVCYNHHVLRIIWRLLVLTNNYAPGLLLNTNIWTKKKINQHAGKWDYQQNLKDILDAAMVSNPEGVTDDSTNVPMTSTPVKKLSARKSLCLFINIFDVRKKTAKRRIGAAKSKRRAM